MLRSWREKTAARMRELRKRKRAQNKQRDIKLSLLEEENELQREENELLRRSIIALREQIERVKKHNYLFSYYCLLF